MKVLALICLGLGFPLGLGGLLVAALAAGTNNGAAFLGVIVAVTPFALFWYFWMKSAGVGRKAFNQFVSQNIARPDYSEWFDGSGIAMDVAGRRIILANKKLQKTYGFDDIREWRSSFHSGGTTQAFGNIGATGHMRVGAANAGALVGNYMASGMFFLVRDIQHPEWQITGIGKKDAARWFEILQQHLNEGVRNP